MFKMKITDEIEQWRHDTLLTKEPETIAWINSFTGGHFIDIGANIGIYSLYCAEQHPDMTVLAFEPFQKNFVRLVENYKLNNYNNFIAAQIAVGGRVGSCNLRMVNESVGSSGHQIQYVDGSCAVITIDAFKTISKIPFHYIKIDTDGNEYEIIQNATVTLADPETRSILIEINDHKQEIREIFLRLGFTDDNEFNRMSPHSRTRRQEENITAENLVFTR